MNWHSKLSLLLLLSLTSCAHSLPPSEQPRVVALSVPTVFGDHMVLQRDMIVPVWGNAAPREEITVSINGHNADAKADEHGLWLAKLPKMKAGGPYDLTVSASNQR